MNWNAISATGEIIGAVGVVVSLIYLAFQVRSNTRAMLAQSARDAVAAMRDFNKSMVEDADLARIFRLGTEGMANLNEEERGRFGHILFNFFKTAEELHYQYIQGTLDPEIWNGWKGIISLLSTSPGFTEYWAMRSSFFTPSFRTEHDSWTDSGLERMDQLAKGVKRQGGQAEWNKS
jgi:hypothetical protein